MTQPPPLVRAPPESLLARYTMGGKIPVLEWVIDNRVPSDAKVYNLETTATLLLDNKKMSGAYEPYPDNRDLLYYILENGYSCVGKSVAVIGTLYPWIEAVMMRCGAKSVVTVEYNELNISEHVAAEHGWSSAHYPAFAASSAQYDIIATFSSIEHDGLGRYGDPLNPEGDLEAMQHIRNRLAPGGLVFWGAPVGRDALVWNAHRVYGPVRLPWLLRGFRAVAHFGPKTYLKEDLCNNSENPWVILSKAELLATDADECQAVHDSLLRAFGYLSP